MRETIPKKSGAPIPKADSEKIRQMENLVTFFLVVLILIFHRPLSAILGGLFAMAVLGVVLVIFFFFLRSMLFGTPAYPPKKAAETTSCFLWWVGERVKVVRTQ